MKDELRRPMTLLVKAAIPKKKTTAKQSGQGLRIFS